MSDREPVDEITVFPPVHLEIEGVDLGEVSSLNLTAEEVRQLPEFQQEQIQRHIDGQLQEASARSRGKIWGSIALAGVSAIAVAGGILGYVRANEGKTAMELGYDPNGLTAVGAMFGTAALLGSGANLLVRRMEDVPEVQSLTELKDKLAV